MAKKNKKQFICRHCGHIEPKWLGRCPDCEEWNSFEEKEVLNIDSNAALFSIHKESAYKGAMPLNAISTEEHKRLSSGIEEVDQVLGGGLVPGSAILLGGDPGTGKSTLLLQLSSSFTGRKPVLYVSGEESPGQIRNRSLRLNIKGDSIELLCETRTAAIRKAVEQIKPGIIIIDSIQTLFSPEAGQIPGTVNQIKFNTYELISLCKEINIPLFLVAHVTKDGSIAGPKAIEHLVDTVLYFEQADNEIRLLRSVKNRFGPTDELGLFTMSEDGLIQINNPSTHFMVERKDGTPPGISLACLYEGSRTMTVEIQALTVPAKGVQSRISSDKVDSARVSRIAAILEKHISLKFSDQDIYINVAGGIKVNEPGVDLAVALALYSARTGIPLPKNLVSAGEMTLAGEIRQVWALEKRIKNMADMGFKEFLTARREKKGSEALNIHEASTINEAIQLVTSLQKKS